MIGIYKITNTITNQCYIGQSIDIEHRWKQHINESKTLRKKNKFYLALNQYGVEAFTFEVLEECTLEQKILDERERYWINHYDSFNNGYNSTPGGQYESSWKYDPQEIRDLWDKGYSTGEIAEIIGCCTCVVQTRLQGYSDYNIHNSFSRAQQHVMAGEGTKPGAPAVPIYQYDLNGQYIAEYKSIHEAARALGHDNANAIYATLRREYQTAYGYQWSKEKLDSMPVVPAPGSGKLLRCTNTNQVFHSTQEAAKWCNLKSRSPINACCRGERKTAGKHPETGEKLKWEYIE